MQNENGYVVTVLGGIEAERLGFCQSHEHLHVSNAWMRAEFPSLCIDNPALVLTGLLAYREAGGRALVDVQPLGTGRDAEVLRFLAEGSGVHIVASTGFHRSAYYPPDHWLFRLGEERLEELFSTELMQGMFQENGLEEPVKHSSIRAGQLKAALAPGPLDEQHIKLFSAVAAAHAMTGAPISVHVERGADPLMLADFLAQRGVTPEKMIFCHLEKSVTALSIHEEMARRGIYLTYDVLAQPGHADGWQAYGLLRHMVDAGYRERLLASPDVMRHQPKGEGAPGWNASRKGFLPAMRAAGLSDQALHQIFEVNPARAFSIG